MQSTHSIRHILLALLLCIRVGRHISAPPPLQLPIFDTIFMRLNNFNESIMDTITYYEEYDFIIIGSGSGKQLDDFHALKFNNVQVLEH